MFDIQKAKRLVTDFINRDFSVPGDELIIIGKSTIEKSYGWVFFYTSKRYLETGNISFLIAGNGPIIFEKDNGRMQRLGTALPAQQYIEEYERQRGS